MKRLSEGQGRVFARAQTDDPVNRHPEDWYPTWPGATRALLSVERFDGAIWEPACGEGDMSKVLEAAGYDVISSDLIDRGYGEGGRDFLMEWQPRAPNIVTNPPFRWAIEFTDRALQLTEPRPDPGWQKLQGADCGCGGTDELCVCQNTPRPSGKRKVALFLRLAFLEGVERGKWFPKTPLARVWIMARRVPMQRGRLHEENDAGGVIAFAWFVWEHGHQGPPSLGWLDWKDAL